MLTVKVDKYFGKILYFLYKTQDEFEISFYTMFSSTDYEYVELIYDKKIKQFVAITTWNDYYGGDETTKTFDTLIEMFHWLKYKYCQVLFATKDELEPFSFYGINKHKEE